MDEDGQGPFPDNGGEDLAAALAATLPQMAIDRASTICYALSNPIRMKILLLLVSRTCCVYSIRDFFLISDSRLSYHLKILRDCGLIEGCRDGKCINYAATTLGVEISGILGSFPR